MEEKVPRVLVIEDSPFETEQIRAALQAVGYDFVVANTGIQGLKLAREVLPDLILLDMVLPDMNGRETCRHLRGQEDLRGIPIIIVTVKGKTEDKVLGLAEGATDYVTKPFEPSELRARVDAVLRMKRLQDELIEKNKELARKNQEYQVLLKQVQTLAITDPVTGLFNRRYFQEVLSQEFSRAQRYCTPFSCLMIDVDQFKKINDTFGHEAGDRVLEELGKIIQLQIRKVDLAARYGGDELAVLLPESLRDDAAQVAQRILERVAAANFPILGKKHQVTVSIGVAGFPDPELRDARQAILAADFALYRAKRAGGNRVETMTVAEMESA
ncbi:MAG: diguanylate cyclase [Candidatus Manganitrophaceae bacterium]|nr:MAG: diguanylate cyclase [Candidatus Manganitrophaceae bacterium]